MLSRDAQKTSILRTLISEIERQPACGTADAQRRLEFAVVRKLIEGNSETLKHLPVEDARHAALTWENEFLSALLPKTLSVAEVKAMLLGAHNLEAIKTAKSDGQATGEAMKYLKGQSAEVQGQDVQAAVKEIRGETA
jgi:uncharacterized protein YqeY